MSIGTLAETGSQVARAYQNNADVPTSTLKALEAEAKVENKFSITTIEKDQQSANDKSITPKTDVVVEISAKGLLASRIAQGEANTEQRTDNLQKETKKEEIDTQQRTTEKITEKTDTQKRAELEPSDEEKQVIDELSKRDREVRNHEQAHLSAAGNLAQGGANFSFTSGPDGKKYATGGEVNVDTSPGKTPEETIDKAARISAAANAPAQPSAQDTSVSAQATAMAAEARAELAAQGDEVAQKKEEVSDSSSIQAETDAEEGLTVPVTAAIYQETFDGSESSRAAATIDTFV